MLLRYHFQTKEVQFSRAYILCEQRNEIEQIGKRHVHPMCTVLRFFFPEPLQFKKITSNAQISDFGVSKETIGFQGNKFVSFTFRIKQVTRRAYSNITKAHALQGSYLVVLIDPNQQFFLFRIRKGKGISIETAGKRTIN